MLESNYHQIHMVWPKRRKIETLCDHVVEQYSHVL